MIICTNVVSISISNRNIFTQDDDSRLRLLGSSSPSSGSDAQGDSDVSDEFCVDEEGEDYLVVRTKTYLPRDKATCNYWLLQKLNKRVGYILCSRQFISI